MGGSRAVLRLGVVLVGLGCTVFPYGGTAEAAAPPPPPGSAPAAPDLDAPFLRPVPLPASSPTAPVPVLPVPSAACVRDACLAAPCAPRRPCDEPRRGPVEVRDPYLLAQPRLTLPATSPDTLGCGVTSLRAQLTSGNSFGWGQSETGESPADRQFLVDGESRTLEVVAMRGVTPDLDLGLRLPLQWRGAGWSDPLIDTFHELTSFVTMDNMRGDFRTNAFRIEGRTYGGDVFNADRDTGTGLGDVEAIARWRFRDGGRDGTSLAAVGRVTLPTGTGPFDAGGIGVGLQVVGARRVAPKLDVFAGVGGTWFSDTHDMGFTYEAVRGQVFAAVEWRPARTWSLVYEMDYTTALVDDVVRFHPQHFIMNLAAKIDVRPDTVLELGFIENFIHQQSTVDIAIYVGVELRR